MTPRLPLGGKLPGDQGAHQVEHIPFLRIYNLPYFLTNPTTFSALKLGFQCSFAKIDYTHTTMRNVSYSGQLHVPLEMTWPLICVSSVSHLPNWRGSVLTQPSVFYMPGLCMLFTSVSLGF